MSNPNINACAEDEAVLVEMVEATMSPNHDRLCIRKWEGIDITYIDEVVSDLRMRTSMNNPSDTVTNYVEDPQIGDEGFEDGARVLEGRWRGVSVRGEVRNGSGVITQTLAYGLVKSADALPTPELVKTEDTLFYPHGLHGTSERERREVRYRGIDPAYVETLKNTLTLGASNYIEAKSVRMNDGSYNIHLLIETVSFVNTTPTYTIVRITGDGSSRKKTTYRAPEVPVASAQAVVVALGATANVMDAWSETGQDGEAIIYYTISDNTSVQEETGRLVEQCGHIPQVTRTWYDVAAGDIDTVYATAKTYTGEAGDTGYVTKEVFKEVGEDGKATIRAVAWKRQRAGLYVETERYPVARGQIQQVKKTWYDVPYADIGTIYTTAQAYTGESGDVGFTHKTATKSVDEDGCAIIQAIAFKPSRVGTIHETHRTSATDGQLATVTRTYYGVAPTNITSIYNTAKGYTGESGDSGYVHKEADKSVHEDGYATIWCTAWKLPRENTEQQVEERTWTYGQYPSVRRTWFDVPPGSVAAVWTTAKAYDGTDEGKINYVNKFAAKNVAQNGYATITAEAWYPPYTGSFTEKTGQVKYEIVANPSATDVTADAWRYKKTTYNVKRVNDLGDALDYIDGGLPGSNWTTIGSIRYLATKVTRIQYSTNIYTGENIDTNAFPPASAGY